MTNIDERNSRDEVLFAFDEAFERPTVDQIIEWVERYPQFAEEIRAHAAISWDLAAHADETREEPDEAALANAFSWVLSAMYETELQRPTPKARASNDATAGFYEILSAKGKDFVELVREIGGDMRIKRTVIADLFNGSMLPPIAPRISRRVETCLSLSSIAFRSALDYAIAHPRLGHANAATVPRVIQRSCEEVVRTSGMTDEQIDYWLGTD